MRLSFSLSCAAAAAAFWGTALAEGGAGEDGLYLRGEVGVSFARDWTQDFTYNPNVVFVTPPPAGQTIDNGNGKTFGAALGFDYADGIRTELEYRYATTGIDAVAVDDPVGGPTPVAFAKDQRHAHFLMANFYFDLLGDGPVRPYVGAGVGGAVVSNEAERQDAALAYQARAGLTVAMGGGLTADLDVSYLRTNDFAFGPNDDEFVAGGPVVRADGARYSGATVMLGFRRRF